jgi:hypothetical protein
MKINYVPLNLERHRDLRLSSGASYQFAASLMICPVVSGEIRQIAREYVIVFPQDLPLPHALTGIDAGTNAFVDPETGRWRGRYVPAHIRRYPFMAAKTVTGDPSGKQAYTVLIDETAPHLGLVKGQPLFTEDGRPSQTLETVQKVLTTMQQDATMTGQMVADLDRQGLLKETKIRVQVKGKDAAGLTGFRVLDADKLMNLPPENLFRLQKSGALLLAYAHLISLTNLKDGMLVTAAGQAPDDGPVGVSSDDLGKILDFSKWL